MPVREDAKDTTKCGQSEAMINLKEQGEEELQTQQAKEDKFPI